MHYNLLSILAVGFALALVFGFTAHKFKLSPIVGYLLAGFLVGPNTPGFEADMTLAHELSEAGVILLMFGVGLHFDLKDLLAVKGVSLPGAIAQSSVATFFGCVVAMAFGYTLGQGIILGLCLSVASTVVLLRVLSDHGVLDTVQGHVAVGWLVVEDLLTVLILVLLPSLAGIITGTQDMDAVSLLKVLGKAALNLVLLWVIVMVIGKRVIPLLLNKILQTRSQELFTLAVLVAAFATAVGSSVFFGASMALGAFLGGMVIGSTKVSYQAGADVLPLRDAFAVLFFVSVGMLFDPSFVMENPLIIVACLLVVLVIKPLTAILVVNVLGYTALTALTTGVSLAQVGEFSFILAQQGVSLKIIPQNIYSIVVVCALISITLNPSLFGMVPKMQRALRKHPRIWSIMNDRAEKKAQSKAGKVVRDESLRSKIADVPSALIVGYGPAGRSATKTLQDEGYVPVVIDLNVDTVNSLNNSEDAIMSVFGNSTKKEVLEAAGIHQSQYLVITLPQVTETAVTAALAKELNPDIRIFVRSRFMRDSRIFEQASVTGVVFEEATTAESLSRMLLEDIHKQKSGGDGRECTMLEGRNCVVEEDADPAAPA